MAAGDIVVFNEAKAKMLDGDWASLDHIYCAICNNTTTPTAATVTPALTSFTEVGTAGSYIAGGTDLGTIAALVTQAAGTMTFDSATNPSWATHASNSTNAYWAILYNQTKVSKDALAYVDLGGPINMTTSAITLNWNALGIFTISTAV